MLKFNAFRKIYCKKRKNKLYYNQQWYALGMIPDVPLDHSIRKYYYNGGTS